MKDDLTIPEAALLIGRDKSNIWRWIRSGKLRAYLGEDGTQRVKRSELLRVEPTVRRGRPVGTATRR